MRAHLHCRPVFWFVLTFCLNCWAFAAEKDGSSESLAAVLPEGKWQQVEGSVDRALSWIAARQSADGSFPTTEAAQPAVTSLAVMALLSRGHQPGFGRYGAAMERGIDFVLSCQSADGLFSYRPPGAQHA